MSPIKYYICSQLSNLSTNLRQQLCFACNISFSAATFKLISLLGEFNPCVVSFLSSVFYELRVEAVCDEKRELFLALVNFFIVIVGYQETREPTCNFCT